MAFMRAVNPCVDWTETQWRLIVDEACLLPSTQHKLHCITTCPKECKAGMFCSSYGHCAHQLCLLSEAGREMHGCTGVGKVQKSVEGRTDAEGAGEDL